MTSTLITLGVAYVLAAAFIGWAYVVHAQSKTRMRDFLQRWETLTPSERKWVKDEWRRS